MSTHEVKVIRITEIHKHPNADALELIPIWDYTACVRLGDFKVGDLIAYIEPDYVVPDTEQFAFLKGKRRIKCKRLRGVMSQGLVIPAPAGSQEGDDVMELLGIIRYVPPEKPFRCFGGGTFKGTTKLGTPPPGIDSPKYGLENYRKNTWMFKEGDLVSITEKIHGCNARYVYCQDRMWVGSHNSWRDHSEQDAWWLALSQNTWIEDWCKANPEHILYGEIYGAVQDLEYGMPEGQLGFKAFDIYHNGKCFSLEEFQLAVPAKNRTPELFFGPFSKEILLSLVDGKTTMPGADHIREGVVIAKWNVDITGNTKLKYVSDEYLSRQ